jgi:hypothetical protein
MGPCDLTWNIFTSLPLCNEMPLDSYVGARHHNPSVEPGLVDKAEGC